MTSVETERPAPRRVQVIKVPLEYTPVVPIPNFGRIRRNFLELLENKARVKEELRDLDYDPDKEVISNPPDEHPLPRESLPDIKPPGKRLVTTSDAYDRLKITSSSPVPSRVENGYLTDEEEDEYRKRVHDQYRREMIEQDELQRSEEISRIEAERRHAIDYEESSRASSRASTRSSRSSRTSSRASSRSNRSERSDRSGRSSRASSRASKHSVDSDHYRRVSKLSKEPTGGSYDRFSKFVMQGGDKNDLAPNIAVSKPPAPRRHESGSDRRIETPVAATIAVPSLSQLKGSQSTALPSVSNQARRLEITAKREQSEEKEREDLLMKLYRLKTAFPEGDIPGYSESTDTPTLRRIVEQTRRKLHVNRDTEQYKEWSAMIHMVLEYVLVKVLKMKSATGLAENHIRSSHKYNELLMEFGDQQYHSGPSKWPVHWRLLGMVTFETAMFIGANVMMQKLANGLLDPLTKSGQFDPLVNAVKSAGRGTGPPPVMAQPPAFAFHPGGMAATPSPGKMKGPDISNLPSDDKRKRE